MSEILERAARAIAARTNITPYDQLWASEQRHLMETARAVLEAISDAENDMLAAGYEAIFEDKWDGTQAPMMGAGWEAMIKAVLHSPPR